MWSIQDREYMARALVLAAVPQWAPHPNPRVGCVIVNNDQIVGEGYHAQAGQPHAEVNALTQAGAQAKDATVYVSLEPCSHHGKTPPCADALIQAQVAEVVIAMQDPNPRVSGEGLKKLQAAGIRTRVGLNQDMAEQLNRGFIKRMKHGLPWVSCKIAMSVDGRTAMKSGESQWISSAQSREDVQLRRAQASAILTGIGTVLADNPRMTIRSATLSNQAERQPIRVVVDSALRIPADAEILKQAGETWIATVNARGDRIEELRAVGAKPLIFPGEIGKLQLPALLQELARRDINEVLVEAGARLNGALLNAGLIDELVIYMAPKLMGDAARGLFHLPGLERMEQSIGLEIKDIRAIGVDWRIIAQPVTTESRSN